MLEFIFAAQNFPFLAALVLMLIIAAMEGVGAVFGVGFSSVMADADLDADLGVEGDLPDLSGSGALGRIASWLQIRNVPLLAVLVVWLLLFGSVGLLVQDLSVWLLGMMLPAFVAALLSFTVTLPLVRLTLSVLARVIPKDETSAVSRSTLIGRVATVTLGTGRSGYACQVKVKDRFGKTLYLMAEPDDEEEVFAQGDAVLLVKDDGTKFYAIKTSSTAMVDA